MCQGSNAREINDYIIQKYNYKSLKILNLDKHINFKN